MGVAFPAPAEAGLLTAYGAAAGTHLHMQGAGGFVLVQVGVA